jgi:hypothetical protein
MPRLTSRLFSGLGRLGRGAALSRPQEVSARQSAGSPGHFEPLGPDDFDRDEFEEADEERGAVPPEGEAACVDEIKRWVENAKAARAPLEGLWIEAMAAAEGYPFVEWDERQRRLSSIYTADDRHRYVCPGVVKELLEKFVARATQSKPDASPVAVSQADLDQTAAREARAIFAECERELDPQGTLRRLVYLAGMSTTAFLQQYWDEAKEALVPVFGPSGVMTGARLERVGGVCERVFSGLDVLLDPSARSWDEVRRLCIVMRVPPEYVKSKYGLAVEPDDDDTLAYVDALFTARSRGARMQGAKKPNLCTLYVVEDKAGGAGSKYPQGRYTVVVGNRLARYQVTGLYPPYDKFSVIPLGYLEAQGTPYDLGKVDETALASERAIGRISSRWLEKIEKDRIFIFEGPGTQTAPDAYEDDVARIVKRVPIGPQTPQITPMAPVSRDWADMIQYHLGRLQDHFGVHDISQGKTPAGVTAGSAIELLLESDTSQMSIFLQRVERFSQLQREGWLRLYSLFAKEPRITSVDESGSSVGAQSGVVAFDALSQGGQVRVHVIPGSAVPKTPAAKNELYITLYNAGAMGPPGSPEANIMLWRLLSDSRSDEGVEHALDMLQQREEQQQAEQAAMTGAAQSGLPR